jgi:hypothetical protein
VSIHLVCYPHLQKSVAHPRPSVQALEQQLQPLLSRSEAPKTKRPSRRETRTTGPLPKRFVSLRAFASHHNVAEAKVQTHVEMGLLAAKRGEWTDRDGTMVMLALDTKGRRAFYQVYHGVPPFVECNQCPH